jgi:multidrug efflux pump subunit AcrA (membrane-fusion protein)
LKAALTAKAAAVVAAEDQLQQERAARQEAEGQLQQERAALVEARAVLEREHAALEGAQASLKEREEEEVSKLDGELIALSISNEDQRRSLEEQSATVVSLQQAVEGRRQALEVKRKHVEGELPFCSFVLLIFPSGVRSLLDFPCSWCPGMRTALGHATDRAEALQAAYGSSEWELVELRASALETC